MKISSAGFSGLPNVVSFSFEKEFDRELIFAFFFVGLFVAAGDVGKFVVTGDLSGKDASEMGLLFFSFNEIGVRLCLGVFDTCSIISWLDLVCLSFGGGGGEDEVKMSTGGSVSTALSEDLTSNEAYMGRAEH